MYRHENPNVYTKLMERGRKKLLVIRLTEREFLILREKAKEAGKNLSTYIRGIFLS